jgi:hypothetical protein
MKAAMKRSTILALVVVLLVTALACGSITGRGRSSSGELEFKIVNRSPDEVCYVLISPSSEEAWGTDRLDDNEVIKPGASRVFKMEKGTYDLQVETCNEEVMATAWEVDQSLTVTVGERGAGVRLSLSNDSSEQICVVRISPAAGAEWGEDWLGSLELVYPGSSRIFYVKADAYDLQASDCDGVVLVEEYNVDLTQDLAWAVGN